MSDFIPWDELFPGSLNADSIGEGNTILVTIESLRNEEVSEIGPGQRPTGKTVTRPVMKFADYGDWWVLNKTNKDLLGQCLGRDTSKWKGRTVGLKSIKTGFFGGKLAIRVCGAVGMSAPVQTDMAVSQSKTIRWTLEPLTKPGAHTTEERIAKAESMLTNLAPLRLQALKDQGNMTQPEYLRALQNLYRAVSSQGEE
jgi:hypothetical protein